MSSGDEVGKGMCGGEIHVILLSQLRPEERELCTETSGKNLPGSAKALRWE